MFKQLYFNILDNLDNSVSCLLPSNGLNSGFPLCSLTTITKSDCTQLLGQTNM